MTAKKMTDGAHYRAVNDAMDAIWEAVKAARADGLKVDVRVCIEEESEKPDWHLFVQRPIDEKSP